MLALLAVVVLALLIFISILSLDIPGMWKFFLSVFEMILIGQIFIRRFNMDGEIGLILLRSKHGLKLINSLAKNEGALKFLSDTGTTIAYGLLSIPLMRGNVSWKSVITGMLVLLVLIYGVAPFVAPFLSDVLGIGVIDKARETVGISAEESASLLFILGSLALIMIGGLFIFLVSSIVLYGLYVLSQLVSTILYGTGGLSDIAPGGTLLLPGINLPLFEGIAALVIILAVHEVAHAVLARIAKVPVLSSGIVLFGIIPIGAFVEPDEKKLEKVDRVAQTRVIVAGSTSNLMFSIFFFLAFILFSIFLSSVDLSGIPFASGGAYFIYIVLGMCFALNFIVGMVNLLPLPFFDGYRLLDINIENKLIIKSLMIITLLAFAMNFVPHFFA